MQSPYFNTEATKAKTSDKQPPQGQKNYQILVNKGRNLNKELTKMHKNNEIQNIERVKIEDTPNNFNQDLNITINQPKNEMPKPQRVHLPIF